MNSRLVFLGALGVIAGAALASALFGLVRLPSSNSGQAIEVGKPLIGGPFTLTDQTGKRVTEKDFAGRYTLIFFGYTHCPDICPSALQVIAAALDKLGDKAKEITPVFISLDGERDTPAKMADYLASFGKNFVGLTGAKDDVAVAAKAYRVFYQVVPDEKTPGEYTIDHAAIIYLMGKDGQFVTHIPHTTNVDQVVEILNKAIP